MPNPITLPEYLNPPSIARMLGVNQDKVLGWIRSGELTAVDVSATRGGRPRWRIARADLDSFLNRRRATPPPKVRRRSNREYSAGAVRYR